MTDCTCSYLPFQRVKSHEITSNYVFIHKRLQICDNCKFIWKRENLVAYTQANMLPNVCVSQPIFHIIIFQYFGFNDTCICDNRMHLILDDALACALIKTGNTDASKNTLSKRLHAARLISLNLYEFQTIASKYTNHFLCDRMVLEIRIKLISYCSSMTTNIFDESSEEYVQIPSLKRWIEDSKNGVFWPTRNCKKIKIQNVTVKY